MDWLLVKVSSFRSLLLCGAEWILKQVQDDG
ncbi:hypothetical protein L288_16630 [Sphingobium quisquiliarum P25]|uniref:Uncharacterized protein n=1 Tax=Sphingobium quisquiliarum P25 TaxID=1329909 RepID=T0HXR9_9SPHN|nr:hypothetical protein L288_16630 [Sphingobium quisquiliarum P25]